MGVKERILLFIKDQGTTKAAFEKKAGLSNGYIKNFKGNLGEAKLEGILSAFPRLNRVWLLTGEGSMLNPTAEVANKFPLRTDRDVEIQSIPLYEMDATAGLVSLFDVGQQIPVSHLAIPNLPPCDGALYVRGDSMYPLLKSGDIVLYRQVIPSMENILWGEMYLLSFAIDGEEYISVKYIQKADRDGYVRLVSHNPHHSPKDIPADNIRALALIKASVRYCTMG